MKVVILVFPQLPLIISETVLIRCLGSKFWRKLPKTPLPSPTNQYGDPALHPGSITTDSQAPTLQPHHRPQANRGSPESTGAHEGPPLLMQRQRNVVNSIPWPEYPNAYVGQTGRQTGQTGVDMTI